MDVAVGLVKTYLELSGYFVLTELPVRVADPLGYHDVTDLDILAVRFPHDHRPLSGPLDLFLGADPTLAVPDDEIDVIVGEVKEGAARLNPALRRATTVAFALRRVGCVPEGEVDREANALVSRGSGRYAPADGPACRMRLVAFAGHGASVGGPVAVISLERCEEFIAQRLRDGRAILHGAQLKDPVLALFALHDKLAQRATDPGAAQPDKEATP